MTIADALLDLAKVNLALAAGTVLTLLLRAPVRRHFGARVGYGLWWIPLACLAVLWPARTLTVASLPVAPLNVPETAAPSATSPVAPANAPMAASSAEPEVSGPAGAPTLAPALRADPWTGAMVLWLTGILISGAWLVRKQRDFLEAMRRGRAGPAVVGFVAPRIVTPDDFTQRYSAREQAVVLAHEEAHIARGDSRINGLVAAGRCLCWFNPLVHLAAFEMRVDQELACDAAVLERLPKSRRTYALAMLKAEGGDQPLPVGCHWPAGARNPLLERIAMLKSATPNRRRRLAGGGFILILASASALSAWALQPARVVEAPAPADAAPAASVKVDPADPLVRLASDVAVIFDIGTPHPRLMIQENDHGVSSTSVLGLGEEYRDGWKLSGVTEKTVTLAKLAQSRTITLTGKVQVASSAPAPTPAKPADPAKPAAKPATSLAEAIAQRNIGDIIKFGGTPKDIATALIAGGARPGGDELIPESAAFMQAVDGKVGLFVLGKSGITYVAYGTDYDGYVAPGGVGTLPSIGQVIARLDVQTEPSGFIPAPTLEAAISAGYTNQVIAMGASAQDIARAYLAAGATAGGAPIDPSTAVLIRSTGPVPALGITVAATNGAHVTLMSSDFQRYPGSRDNLPSPQQVLGLPPLQTLYPQVSLADALADEGKTGAQAQPTGPISGAAPVSGR